ncbi:hypothetical protein PFISCL1PPCAC_16905 [Pristionchus fissidentatus]|uniref:Uncharacterized protein n=1 Tax=Pristionchus fissidentatus TaxID=1538716 RepID=A0AAV5W1Z7_9BILA|nr:hypothetical protein PFISCL1PPCAC_16905 [Pristionchus fissidentatus]
MAPLIWLLLLLIPLGSAEIMLLNKNVFVVVDVDVADGCPAHQKDMETCKSPTLEAGRNMSCPADKTLKLRQDIALAHTGNVPNKRGFGMRQAHWYILHRTKMRESHVDASSKRSPGERRQHSHYRFCKNSGKVFLKKKSARLGRVPTYVE